MPDPRIEVISWSEFQEAIAPMWGVSDPSTITIINNPYRVINLPVADWPKRIIHYPLRFVEDGIVKGYTAIYNVSLKATRIRGIFILPEHRGNGAGMRMTKAAQSVFPPGFHRMIGFFKEENVERFIQHCDFAPVPDLGWLWSDYQKVRIRAMCWDRSCAPESLNDNITFLDRMAPRYGLGGSNNLDRSWSELEWNEFVEPHVRVYPDVGLNVDF